MSGPMVAATVLRRKVVGLVGDPGIPRDLETLYREYGVIIYKAAYRLLQSPDDAEDVLQDVFVRLPDVLHTYSGQGSFEGWIRRIAVRIALMKLRTRKRRAEVPFDAVVAPGPGEAPERSLADRMTLERAIAGLPTGLRAVYVLKEIEGYRHEEVAGMLGIGTGASEVRLHRARRLLRKRLERSR